MEQRSTLSAVVGVTIQSFALSVQYEDSKTKQHSVRHYRVKAGAGNTYYVSLKRTFHGFSKLIEHYSSARARRPLSQHYCVTALHN